MSKSTGRMIGRWAGVSMSAALAGAGAVALRHALETPQPLKSVLPGEAHLYRWQRRSIFYKVLGAIEAPPLVLLHRPEIGASGHEMLPIMAPLAQTYRVYAPDLLGFGLSDRPSADYSAELYSALCQDFLREVVQGPATLVASGLSCNYAVAAAANAPDLCTSLVLISPLALQEEPQPSALKQYAQKPPVKTLLYPLLSTRLAFLLMRQFQQESKEDFPQFYANTHQLGAEHAAMARLAGRLAGNMEQQFAMLQQPILMIWGTNALENQHTVASLHKMAMLANPARQARKVELIQGAALTAHIDQPESVITAIKRWQEEIKLPAPEEALAFTFQAANQHSTSAATALAEPAPTLIPQPKQSKSSGEAADSSSAPTPVPTQSDEAEETLATIMPESNQGEGPEIVAYCVKCKQKRKMLKARKVVMKNGRPAMRGVCPVCGTRINRIGGVS